jgi:alpha-soluble NSF attachment protein
MTDNDSKNADALVKKADETLNKWLYFGNRWEAALELYTKAANLYKMTKKWNEAGQTFLKIAQCHFKLDSKHEAAGSYVEAANAFRRSNPQGTLHTITSSYN